MLRTLPLAGLLLLFVLPASAQITAEDVVNIRNVGAVAISPDGQHVAYTVTHPRTDEDPPGGNWSELFVIPFEGGEAVQITHRPQMGAAPQWLPNGRLAFISRDVDEHPMAQVYTVDTAGGGRQRLTDSPEGIMRFVFSSDGSKVFYTARQPEAPEVAAARERGYDQIVAGENERHIHLFVQSTAGGERRPVSPANRTVNEFAVSQDGNRVAMQLTRTPSIDDDMMFRQLFYTDLSTGETEQLAPHEGKLGPMAWSPGGRYVAYIGATEMSDPLPHLIYVTEVGTNRASTPMARYEGTVEWLTWRDDDTILFNAVEGTRTAINTINVRSGTIERIIGHGMETSRAISVANDGNRFASAVNSRIHPNELYTGSLRAGTWERRSNHNEWLLERRMARQETIEWRGPGGMTIEGVLVYPLDYIEGQRYPLAILPHGGPEGISVDGWNTRPLYPSHVLAREGYVVLKPNYRGSGGRGPAFSKANHQDLGGREFEDVIRGIDYLANIGLVDPNRVGISGTSYGGYFSAWATTRHPDRFRAGITFAGLSNWISFMGTTDIIHEMSLVHWDLYWYEDPNLYYDRSPVTHVSPNSSPTLVVHGLADERVHPEQSIQLYNLLRVREVPTGLVLYPREPHGILERAHQLDFMQRIIDWFDEHVKP